MVLFFVFSKLIILEIYLIQNYVELVYVLLHGGWSVSCFILFLISVNVWSLNYYVLKIISFPRPIQNWFGLLPSTSQQSQVCTLENLEITAVPGERVGYQGAY
jgi:hypothetical protein